MADKEMRKSKAVTVTLFCENCGETKTFRKDDERPHPKSCKECMNGAMIESVSTMEPDAAT